MGIQKRFYWKLNNNSESTISEESAIAELDLKLEAAAAGEYASITKNDVGFF